MGKTHWLRSRKPLKKPDQRTAASNVPQKSKENLPTGTHDDAAKENQRKKMARRMENKAKYIKRLIPFLPLGIIYLLVTNLLNFAWDITPIESTEAEGCGTLLSIMYNLLTGSEESNKTAMYRIILPVGILVAMFMIAKRANGKPEVCAVICFMIYLDAGLMSQLLSSPALMCQQILSLMACYFLFDMMSRPPDQEKWRDSGVLCAIITGINTLLRVESFLFLVALVVAVWCSCPGESEQTKAKVIRTVKWGFIYVTTYFAVVVILIRMYFQIPWIFIGRVSLATYLDEIRLCRWSYSLIVVEILAMLFCNMIECRATTKKFVSILVGVCIGYIGMPFTSGDGRLSAQLVSIQILLLTATMIVMSRQKYPILVYVVLLMALAGSWIGRYRFKPVDTDETDVFLL